MAKKQEKEQEVPEGAIGIGADGAPILEQVNPTQAERLYGEDTTHEEVAPLAAEEETVEAKAVEEDDERKRYQATVLLLKMHPDGGKSYKTSAALYRYLESQGYEYHQSGWRKAPQ